MADILEEADEILLFDALVSTYARLERKMSALKSVMERAGGEVKPVAMQISDPFKQNGVAQVAVIYELSDGQTVSVYFHNPDVTPQRIAPADELISWRWLLNKRDITLVVAPERGQDLNVNTVASRIMQLATKNSPAFQRANARRAERMKQIEELKAEIAGLEKELASAQSELEAAKLEYEDRSMN
ncbi:MAG: defense against restriction DarA-related protein, partial [Methylobacter sp.]